MTNNLLKNRSAASWLRSPDERRFASHASRRWPNKTAGFTTILLWKNGDETNRSPGATGNFHGKGHQPSAGRRDLLELRHIFEAIQARAVDYPMDHKILRRTIVDAGRVDPNSMNVSFAHQKLRDFL